MTAYASKVMPHQLPPIDLDQLVTARPDLFVIQKPYQHRSLSELEAYLRGSNNPWVLLWLRDVETPAEGAHDARRVLYFRRGGMDQTIQGARDRIIGELIRLVSRDA